MVIIISGSDDVHAMAVHNAIVKAGGQACIVDVSQLTQVVFCNDLALSYIKAGRQRIQLRSISSLWYRRPYYHHIEAGITGTDARSFVEREWKSFYEGVLKPLPIFFVNRIESMYDTYKPRQLAAAKKVGLHVPVTLITNSKKELLAFYKKHKGKIIHKSMTATNDVFLTTKLFTAEDLSLLDNLYCCPVIFQEYINGKYDYRVTVIGKEIFTARLSTHENKGLVDSRLDLNLKYEAYEFSKEINDKILLLMEELGLVFGTIDFKMNTHGDIYFLEVNPQGQFIYVELLTGMPLVKSMARLLMNKMAGQPPININVTENAVL